VNFVTIRSWVSSVKPAGLLIAVMLAAAGCATQDKVVLASANQDTRIRVVVQAFQMHFLPWQVTGEFTADTVAVLYALLEKYYPSELGRLLQGK